MAPSGLYARLCHALSFIVKNGEVLKVIVSHVHFSSGSISGMELERNTVTTSH